MPASFPDRPRVPDFSPNPKHEEPRGAIETWSEANWARVPELVRKDVEGHLQHLLLKQAPEVLEKWRDQHKRGIRIGSDDPMFHLGVGMAIRNACRDQLTDGELPAVTLDHEGQPYGRLANPPHDGSRNWDDHYFGVLAAIAA